MEPPGRADALIERDDVAAALASALRGATRGDGTAALILGPAGVGKSSALDLAADLARDCGLRTLRGRGWHGERDFAFGLAQQVLEPALRAAPGEPRRRLAGLAGLTEPVLAPEATPAEGPISDPRHAALLGLYWLLADAAEATPTAVLVDDAHWADRASAEWLAFTARRLAGTRVALIAAARTDEPGDGDAVVHELQEAGATALPLRALTPNGVRRLLAQRLADDVPTRFAAACHESTGGTPLLAVELARAIAGARVPVADSAVDLLRDLRSATVDRLTAQRLARMPADAARLARAIAVLQRHATIHDAAALAAMGAERAAIAADVLRRAAWLEPAAPRFAHPLVEWAVYETIPVAERGVAHRRAARLLAARHAPADVQASHLLRTDPASDPEVVSILREAARRATARGAAESAATMLRRAEREAVETDRATLLLELGEAESRIGDPAALDHLEQAVHHAPGVKERADALTKLARALIARNRFDEALRAGVRAVDELATVDREAAVRLEAELVGIARLVPGGAAWVRRRRGAVPVTAGRTLGERVLQATLAWDDALSGTIDATRAAAAARRALADPALLETYPPESTGFLSACVTLTWCDQLSEVGRHLTHAAELTRRRGSRVALAYIETWQAEAHVRAGRLREAVMTAQDAIELGAGLGPVEALAPSWLAMALLAHGRLDTAEAALADAHPDGIPTHGLFAPALFARGAARAARLDHSGALDDLLEAGRLVTADGIDNPALLPWRSAAARACAALGRTAEARKLAESELRSAVAFGAPRAVAIALRGVAVTAEPSEAIRLYRKAAEVAGRSEARLEHATALHDLGAALRRAGRRSEARVQLEQALDRGTRLGAAPLAASARDELRRLGARPRRDVLTGRDALTPSELRVAELAAAGMSNREIAQSLFVTVKTVETHLSRSYTKCGVATRRQLGAALGDPLALPPPPDDRSPRVERRSVADPDATNTPVP